MEGILICGSRAVPAKQLTINTIASAGALAQALMAEKIALVPKPTKKTLTKALM